MPKTKISEFSATPASNTDIDSINIAEGCAPSGINDAIRELMAQLKDFQTGAVGDSFNGPVGTTTAAAGAFTTLSASSTLTVTGAGSIQGLTVGRGAGAVSTNTAVGASALATNSSGSSLTAVGANSLLSNTTGNWNTGVGIATLYSNTTGTVNSAVGQNAMYFNTTGAQNTGVGAGALYSNTTASYNTAVGYQASYSNITGTETTALGWSALRTNTGNYNTAIGSGSMYSNTSGVNNTAIGVSSLASNTTASNNTAVGYQAGYVNTAADNAFFGWKSGFSNTTGTPNAFFGVQSGYSNTTGTSNTFIGQSAGYFVTTGSKNTILGAYTGNQGGLDIRTASNYIVLSDGDGNPRGIFDNGGRFIAGTTTAVNTAHTFSIGTEYSNSVMGINTNSSTPYGFQSRYTTVDPNSIDYAYYEAYNSFSSKLYFGVRSNGGIANYQANNVNLSDRREKINFAPAGEYLAKICAIPVQTFNYIDQNLEEDGGLTLGVIAQDVQAVAPELVMESNWAGRDDEPKMRLSIYQTDLQYALMKCIQEQQAIINSLKARLDAANL